MYDFNIETNNGGSCNVRIGTERILHLSFEGTAGWKDILASSSIVIPHRISFTENGERIQAKAAYGPLMQAREIFEQVKGHLQFSVVKEVWYSGHSLGGAVGLLVSLMILAEFPELRGNVHGVIKGGACAVDDKIRDYLMRHSHVKWRELQRDPIPDITSWIWKRVGVESHKGVKGLWDLNLNRTHCAYWNISWVD